MGMDLLGNFGMPRLNNFEFFSEIATLGFISGNDAGKNALEVMSSLKIANEIYQRLNEDDNRLELLRAKTILRISDYVKKNPRASEEQLAKEVQKEIQQFATEAAVILQ